MERRETAVVGAAPARRNQQLRPNQPELWLRTVLPDVRAWLRETRAGGRDALAGAYAFGHACAPCVAEAVALGGSRGACGSVCGSIRCGDALGHAEGLA